jgi:hypothetical protein
MCRKEITVRIYVERESMASLKDVFTEKLIFCDKNRPKQKINRIFVPLIHRKWIAIYIKGVTDALFLTY